MIAHLPRLALVISLAGCTKADPADTDSVNDTIPVDDTDTDAVIDTDATDQGPLACSPAYTTLLVTGTPQTVQIEATIDTGDGPTPATDVSWVFNGPGRLDDGGLYTSPADYGGVARIVAVVGTHTAECTVDVEANVVIDASGSSGVPAAFDATAPTVSDDCAPTLLYPLADSAMPGSFAPPLIQWRDSNATVFALELSSQWTTFTVYTTATTYQPTADAWYGLTHYDPGEAVRIRLTGGSWTGSGFVDGTCTATVPTTIEVTDGSLDGTIVYWAPPITKSVTFTSGMPASNEVVDLPGAVCQGCHAVNLHQPWRMTYGPSFPGRTNLVDLGDPTEVLQTWGNGFSDMKEYGAPDRNGEYVVITGMQLAQGATMTVFHQDTGSLVATVTTSRSPTMANWSPDGTKLVYAGCDDGASVMGATNCDLYVQTWDPSTLTFGGETRIATHAAGETLYYPTFSPDSTLVAYNRAVATTDSEGNTVTSYANPKAKVMIVSASGGTPMELSAANGTGDLTNSWPRWAPAYGTYAWLAYSSKRDYGSQVSGVPQLWVTAIDLEIAATGAGDPSKAPTWIPGQLITEGNHTPTWLPNKDSR